MDDTPDYQNYSLEQLYDAAQHIDKEKYPERYELVTQEILTKEKRAGEEVIAINEQFFLTLRMIGAYIIGAILLPIILFWPLRWYIEWAGVASDINGGVALVGLLIFTSFAFGALGAFLVWRARRK